MACWICAGGIQNVHADWPHFAGDAARRSHGDVGPAEVSAVLWTASIGLDGEPLLFNGPSSPVVFDGRVYAVARMVEDQVHVADKLVALDAATGAVAFETPVAASAANSWSSPAVDAGLGQVLVASGAALHAIDAVNGAMLWATPLSAPVVNASPLVVDDLPQARAFMTDYAPFGGGRLYCINLNAFDADANPYLPGEIVWTETLGAASGNTPAYAEGVVYVTSVSGPVFNTSGRVYAIDPEAAEGSRVRWSYALPEAGGFFGGAAVSGGAVYAATYGFSGSGDNSRMVKLDAASGAEFWRVACERTDSIPVVSEDRIYLAAGLDGYGSATKLQIFEDLGDAAVKTWDSFTATGGTLRIGGWIMQPAMSGEWLYVGASAGGTDFFGAATDLYVLDTGQPPGSPPFFADHRAELGSSPAVSGGRIYTIGAGGLSALGARGDFCGVGGVADGIANGGDVQCFVDAVLSMDPSDADVALGDFDEDGELTPADAPGFVAALIGM
jgi:outer membrane protein assembly factor BamB